MQSPAAFPYLMSRAGGSVKSDGLSLRAFVMILVGVCAVIGYLYLFAAAYSNSQDPAVDAQAAVQQEQMLELEVAATLDTVSRLGVPDGATAPMARTPAPARLIPPRFETPEPIDEVLWTPPPPVAVADVIETSEAVVIAAYNDYEEPAIVLPTTERTPPVTAHATASLPAPRYEALGLVEVFEYYPDASDDWCADYDHENQSCLSTLTSGDNWRQWIGRAAACPEPIALGSVVEFDGYGRFTCLDRGSSVECATGVCRFAVLVAGAKPEHVTIRKAYLEK